MGSPILPAECPRCADLECQVKLDIKIGKAQKHMSGILSPFVSVVNTVVKLADILVNSLLSWHSRTTYPNVRIRSHVLSLAY